MKDVLVSGVHVFRYSLPFSTPLTMGNLRLDNREGLVIRLNSEDGDVGVGEIAPLDGYSPETFEQAAAQCLSLAPKLKDLNVLEHIAAPISANRDIFPGVNLFPSVLFGIEAAATDLFRNSLKKKFGGGDSHRSFPEIKVNALLQPPLSVHRDGSAFSLEDEVTALVDEGFETIKLKVGREPLQADIERVNGVLDLLGNGKKLRLDANRLWDLDTAVEFGKNINGERLEYIEEPCASMDDIPAFFSGTGIRAALDESLANLEPGNARLPKGVGALVLKPSLLGGITRCDRWIDRARQDSMTPVVSSCFEAGPGLAAIFSLILSTGLHTVPCGLDTLKALQYSLFQTPPLIEDGTLSPRPALIGTGEKIYRFDLMEEIQV